MSRRGRRGRSGIRRRAAAGAAVLASALLVAPGLDAASLLWRDSEGCHVWMVTDGDTVRAWCPGEGPRTLRLLGFDTPEMRGRCLRETAMAVAATYRLRAALWTADEASVHLSGRDDRYGRALARLRIGARDVAGTMIDAGLARPYAGGRREGWCDVS